jgi:hypothetical protein
MSQLVEWVKRKERWALNHNINPISFVLMYFSTIILSYAGTIIFSHGVSVNSNLTWLIGTVMKLVGMATPGLYVVVRGRRLHWRVKPIIIVMIVSSILFFTLRVPYRIKDLIFLLLGN